MRQQRRKDDYVVTTLPFTAESDSGIEHADALNWLATRELSSATAVIYDPPYAVGSPVRGREDGAAGSVFGPLSFLSRTMPRCARALRPGGIVIVFTDWRLSAAGYIASTVSFRPTTCVAWIRNRPGTGLLRQCGTRSSCQARPISRCNGSSSGPPRCGSAACRHCRTRGRPNAKSR
jgi:DNA modification methylase